MMQKREFLRYLEDNNFYELFIECGWNNPQGDTDLGGIEENGFFYHFEQIAERNGFKIVKCEVAATPNPSLCKKIDHYLRRLANDYISIFHLPSSLPHLWLVPVIKTEKRDLVRVEYKTIDQASFLYEKVAGFSFDLGIKTNIVDVREKVQKAFIVDSEKVTKKFYDEFRKQHKTFTSFITGIDDFIDEENKTRPKNQQVENKNKQWYASIMLNRLMFCYFIQRKRFLDGRIDYLRYKLKEVKEHEGDDQFYSFYRSFLIHLFHEGINMPRHDNAEFLKRYGRIPYLNGGLFGEHEIEKKYKNIDISDEAFEKLFAFFDQWNWHLDTSLTASGKDINPDVLGYIFEQYINDRAAMGAYYTKEDITEYIGRNTILPFLIKATKKADERPFKTNGEVWQFLRQSGDKYIYNAVKKGKGLEIPEDIAKGIDTTKPNLLERRSHWNEKTSEALALPTEIWRETIERLQRYSVIKAKIEKGEITEINDFITYNLDIRQFIQDLLTKTDNHLLVKHFYEQLRKITILDPTCGSGAFLFAAMNILEPLYEICIDRIEDWHKNNPNLFKDEVEEIDRKYRSNRQYFIYKSIILRNLYGVDIMVEATEIAKLRLFLKMVAVVEVDLRADNLGLDPLPDIDFNIRCGNSLVGYATEKELEIDLTYGDIHANKEFRKVIEDGLEKTARAFTLFKTVQFTQEEDMESFKKAKQDLGRRLEYLNEALNHRLYSATTDATAVAYSAWKESNQPFHWFAEFYEIISGNKGFDVIIGNPPYVEYSKVRKQYTVRGYKTESCGNLYGFVIERSKCLLNDASYFSLIVPISLICTQRMEIVQKVLEKQSLWLSNYSERPSKLFVGADVALTIFISCPGESVTYNTGFTKWKAETRNILFNKVDYHLMNLRPRSYIEPKICSNIENSVLTRINHGGLLGLNFVNRKTCSCLYYRIGGGRYWKIFTSFSPKFILNGIESVSSRENYLYFGSDAERDAAIAVLSSSFFYWFFILTTNSRDLNPSDLSLFPFSIADLNKDNMSEICKLSKDLMVEYKQKSALKEKVSKKTGNIIYQEFYPRLSKPIIDDIDKVLAKHYGFTEEELDFIINYDIKYRMGEDLNEE